MQQPGEPPTGFPRRAVQTACPRSAHPYWHRVLERIGVPTAPLAAIPLTDAETTVVFVPEPVGDAAERAALRALLVAGASLVADVDELPRLGDAAAGAHQHPIALPAARRLLRTRTTRRKFGQHGDPHCAEEITATTDHGAIRRHVAAALRDAFHAAGLPFVQRAWSPPGHRATFAFRIDADSFDPAATDELRALLRATGIRATWFIDVERHLLRGGAAAVAAIAADGHEVQSHGFRHYTWRSFQKNRDNLARSLATLREWGIEANAAAAPFGTWNGNFARAVRETGLSWSSEFGRCFDDVPGELPLADGSDGGYQIPIHPVCPALLATAGRHPRSIEQWFATRLRESCSRGEPAVLYGHPIGDLQGCPGLLPRLRDELTALTAELGPVWQPTLGELFAFGRAREQAAITCRLDQRGVAVALPATVAATLEFAGAAPLWLDHSTTVPWPRQSGARQATRDTAPRPFVLPAMPFDVRGRFAALECNARRWWREVRLPAPGQR